MSEWRKAFERLSGQTGKTSTAPSFVSNVSFVSHSLNREPPRGGEISTQRGADKADKTDKTTPEQIHNLSASQPASPQRATRPGALPGDPEAPIVDPEATRVLCILELAGVAPRLTPDSRLELAHPERVSPDLRAAATQHQDDIVAVITYRALLERLFPVSAEPLPPPTSEAP